MSAQLDQHPSVYYLPSHNHLVTKRMCSSFLQLTLFRSTTQGKHSKVQGLIRFKEAPRMKESQAADKKGSVTLVKKRKLTLLLP